MNIVLTLSRISGKQKNNNLTVHFSSLLFLVTFFSNYVLLSESEMVKYRAKVILRLVEDAKI